ncbi:MAG TPA: ABC transporter permease [Tepidisphaeraceae bacterium]|jgi:lipopolysaccharide transport system permease protein|nr:ABC transporter permease [Tepidisphaeraceae bacterium]
MLPALWTYQRFIWSRAIGDLRHRYAGTGLGIVWNVVHPLTLIGLYSVIFTGLYRNTPVPGLDSRFAYTLYLCAGFLPWLAFAECVSRGSGAFIDNAPYLKKLPVPEQVFVAQTAASATLGLVVSFSLLVILSLLLGHRPMWTWLLLPVPLVAMQMLGFGIGLLAGTINVFLRDVGQLITIGLQVAMWSLPIVYLIGTLPAWLRPVMLFHPLYPAVAITRDLFLYGQLPEPWMWAALIGWPAIFIAIAAMAFGRLRAEIRDVL